MRIPSSRTTGDAVLQWPIFQSRYPPNFLLAPVFEAGHDPDSDDDEPDLSRTLSNTAQKSSKGCSSITFDAGEEDVRRLVGNFISFVHTKNPILDILSLQKYARHIAENGPGWDEKSCLVVSPILHNFPLY